MGVGHLGRHQTSSTMAAGLKLLCPLGSSMALGQRTAMNVKSGAGRLPVTHWNISQQNCLDRLCTRGIILHRSSLVTSCGAVKFADMIQVDCHHLVSEFRTTRTFTLKFVPERTSGLEDTRMINR